MGKFLTLTSVSSNPNFSEFPYKIAVPGIGVVVLCAGQEHYVWNLIVGSASISFVKYLLTLVQVIQLKSLFLHLYKGDIKCLLVAQIQFRKNT